MFAILEFLVAVLRKIFFASRHTIMASSWKKITQLLLCIEKHCISLVTDNKWNSGKNPLCYTPNYSCLHSMQHKNKCWCLITVVQVCTSASDLIILHDKSKCSFQFLASLIDYNRTLAKLQPLGIISCLFRTSLI